MSPDALHDPLPGVREVPFWLDTPDRPAPRASLEGDLVVDLAIVGGGFTGLWAALQALEDEPNRTVAVFEGATLGWAASGRNGGFCSASLTHGMANGMTRWPDEMPQLHRLGLENLEGIEATIGRYGIEADFERTGELGIAVAPWQVDGLREAVAQANAIGVKAEFLSADEVRERVDSPTYLGGYWEADGNALVDPARLVWGLAEAAEGLGARIFERTRILSIRDLGDEVRLSSATGTVRARRVILGTNAFPSPLRRIRPYIVPVWDHVLVSNPLTQEQRASIGWSGREGLSDAGNQFHYYRLTKDNRILWGGYDALYYYGSDLSARRTRRAETERSLIDQFAETFPTLGDLGFSHAWAGAIDTCSRFSPFWIKGLGGKVASVQGYTGLGVGASRFGARVCLDLIEGATNERTALEMVRTLPVPFPPEPLRWLTIEATRRSIARSDAHEGRRDLWLRTLDRFGLGFDS